MSVMCGYNRYVLCTAISSCLNLRDRPKSRVITVLMQIYTHALVRIERNR